MIPPSGLCEPASVCLSAAPSGTGSLAEGYRVATLRAGASDGPETMTARRVAYVGRNGGVAAALFAQKASPPVNRRDAAPCSALRRRRATRCIREEMELPARRSSLFVECIQLPTWSTQGQPRFHIPMNSPALYQGA